MCVVDSILSDNNGDSATFGYSAVIFGLLMYVAESLLPDNSRNSAGAVNVFMYTINKGRYSGIVICVVAVFHDSQ